MNRHLEQNLEAAGWKTGDAADFFGMTDEQRLILDTRVALARAVRRERQVRKLTQKDLAAMLHSTQPRVAKIESAAPDVSFDQLFKALVVLGGSITIHGAAAIKKVQRRKDRSPRQRGPAKGKAGAMKGASR
jgi:hypothetical protein